MKQRSYSKLMILVMCSLFLVLIIFAGIVVSDAFFSRGSVVIGNRFDHDLDYQVSDAQLSSINQEISKLDNVKSVEVSNSSSLVRVLVEVDASVKVNDATKLVDSVYSLVIKTLPVDKYFSRHDAVRNYDLEINVFARGDNGNSLLINGIKNSSMQEMITKVLVPYDNKKE